MKKAVQIKATSVVHLRAEPAKDARKNGSKLPPGRDRMERCASARTGRDFLSPPIRLGAAAAPEGPEHPRRGCLGCRLEQERSEMGLEWRSWPWRLRPSEAMGMEGWTATAARAGRAGRAGHGATGAAADPLILLKACARGLPTECSVPQTVRSL